MLMAKKKHRKYWFHGSPFMVTWILVCALLLMYTLSRLTLWVFSPGLFPWEGFASFLLILFGGCRFDLSAVFMVNMPVLLMLNLPFRIRQKKWYRFTAAFLFFLGNFVAVVVNLADSVYFRFTQKRMTGDFFNYLKAGGEDLLQLLPQYLKDYWFIVVLLLFFCAFLVVLWKKVRYEVSPARQKSDWIRDVFFFLVVSFFSVIGIRGGFQLKPIHLMTAGQYAAVSHVPLVLNTPFTMIKTWKQTEIREVHYYSDEEELNRRFNPVHQGSKNPWTPMNVVIIILESFSAEHSAFLNPEMEKENYKGYTPFLDSLMSESLVFKAYANGKRSIEGIPAILASLPSWMNNDYITSSFAGNNINTIANLLKEKSYQTAFFHGGNNGTMNFDDFANMAGFDRYYGRNEYSNDQDYDGKWGIYDEPFFQFVASEINKSPKPYLGVVFSLSSHHPYLIPEQHKGRFPAGKLVIHESIGYADYALKQFFRKASTMPWFDNTLFVITADHTSEAFFPFYKTRLGNYSIPLIFYQRNSALKAYSPKVVQQLDIMPSILDYLGYQGKYLAYGGSVFDPEWPRYALSFLNGSYLLVKDQRAMIFNGNNVTGLFDLGRDPLQKIDILGKNDPAQEKLTLFLQAVIQQYNNRVCTNSLTIKKISE